MRHDNAKILGFGLLALAAVLVMRGKKAPGVGKLNPIEQENKRIHTDCNELHLHREGTFLLRHSLFFVFYGG